MIDAIVLTAGLSTIAFVVAWILRPDLRRWIEKPKYRFQANVRTYDESLKRQG